jgi:hypothetical protein
LLYFSYVDVGAGGFRLNTGIPVLDGNNVVSNGSFIGANGNTINWNVVSSIEPNSTIYRNKLTFTASTGNLGNLTFYQYLDEDLQSVSDDIFLSRGSAAAGTLELFTIDGPEIYGVSHGGAYNTSQGLVNASFTGWAADRYNNMKPRIANGTQDVAMNGVIQNLPQGSDPTLGTFSGPADIVSVLAWDVNPNASRAEIITTLGGIPDISDIPGTSQENPVFPDLTNGNVFRFNNASSGLWFDPPFSEEITYTITSPGSLFTEILDFPTGFNNPFTVSVGGNNLGSFGPGQNVDFVALLGAGVQEFIISDIDPLVDSTDPQAFPLQIEFSTPFASFEMEFTTQNTQSTPEPSVLIGLGVLLGCGASLKRSIR